MNADEIRKWHSVFKREDELFEIRLLGDRTYSGYFYDVEQAITALQPYDNFNIYFTVNEVKRACASRFQFGGFQQVKGTATSKQDIEHRWYIPIDVDCERPSGVSSTDEEKKLAYNKAGDVYRFLKSNGFCEPIVCDSSSGYHIYIPIDMDNTQESEQTVKVFLETLSSQFSDEHVKIDQVLYDPNRIIRLPGSFGRKGRSTNERPHRQAKILSVPTRMVRMVKSQIDAFNERYKVVAEQPVRKYGNNGHYEDFNLRRFIHDHNIEVAKEVPLAGGGTKFILRECPWDSGHKAPDSAIFEMPNGAIGFRCLHNSCANHNWHDLRLKFDPQAYEQEQYPPPYQQRIYPTIQPPQPTQPIIQPENAELGKKWLSMSDIKKVNLNELERFQSGFTDLDKSTRGLFFSSLTIVSGSNASGKSSWLNNLLLNTIDQGYKCALWSGELRPDVLKTWVQMVAAGKDYLRQSRNGQFWYVPDDISRKIDAWAGDKFYLYNNEYGSKWEQLFADMQEMVASGVRIFVLDNLFSLDIDIFNGDTNNKQKSLINQLVEFKKKHKSHVILVAHPRKTISFVRKEDIAGVSAIMDAADYIFIIHRVNNDFRKRAGEYFGPQQVEQYFKFGNVIEVAKDRMMGVQDYIVGMYYEQESRRFKNTEFENRYYGWLERPTQVDLFTDKTNDMPFDAPTPNEDVPF